MELFQDDAYDVVDEWSESNVPEHGNDETCDNSSLDLVRKNSSNLKPTEGNSGLQCDKSDLSKTSRVAVKNDKQSLACSNTSAAVPDASKKNIEITFSRERCNSRREVFNERNIRDKRREEDRLRRKSRSRGRRSRSRSISKRLRRSSSPRRRQRSESRRRESNLRLLKRRKNCVTHKSGRKVDIRSSSPRRSRLRSRERSRSHSSFISLSPPPHSPLSDNTLSSDVSCKGVDFHQEHPQYFPNSTQTQTFPSGNSFMNQLPPVMGLQYQHPVGSVNTSGNSLGYTGASVNSTMNTFPSQPNFSSSNPQPVGNPGSYMYPNQQLNYQGFPPPSGMMGSFQQPPSSVPPPMQPTVPPPVQPAVPLPMQTNALPSIQQTGYLPNHPTGYPPNHPTGYPPNHLTGYSPNLPTSYPTNQSAGYLSNQSAGYLANQTAGYLSNQSAGYHSNQSAGYPSNHLPDYPTNQSAGYTQNQSTGYPQNQAPGYSSSKPTSPLNQPTDHPPVPPTDKFAQGNRTEEYRKLGGGFNSNRLASFSENLYGSPPRAPSSGNTLKKEFSQNKVQKDYYDYTEKCSNEQYSASRSRSRSRSMDSLPGRKTMQHKWLDYSPDRSNDSDNFSPKGRFTDQGRIPTPPPPVISSYGDKSDNTGTLFEKKQPEIMSNVPANKGSLCGLLQELMGTSGQGECRFRDPSVKRKIVSSCETFLRQLHKRKMAGLGNFIPDPVEPPVSSYCSSPLTTYHPRVTFNEGSDKSVWSCPGIKVPPIKSRDDAQLMITQKSISNFSLEMPVGFSQPNNLVTYPGMRVNQNLVAYPGSKYSSNFPPELKDLSYKFDGGNLNNRTDSEYKPELETHQLPLPLNRKPGLSYLPNESYIEKNVKYYGGDVLRLPQGAVSNLPDDPKNTMLTNYWKLEKTNHPNDNDGNGDKDYRPILKKNDKLNDSVPTNVLNKCENLTEDLDSLLKRADEFLKETKKTRPGQGQDSRNRDCRSRSKGRRSRSRGRRSRSRGPRSRSKGLGPLSRSRRSRSRGRRSRSRGPRSRSKGPHSSYHGRRSPPRRSPLRRSPPRRSPLRRSPPRRSPLRRSSPRRSPLRRSLPRRSPTRRSPPKCSPPRRSPTRRSPDHNNDHDSSRKRGHESQDKNWQAKRSKDDVDKRETAMKELALANVKQEDTYKNYETVKTILDMERNKLELGGRVGESGKNNDQSMQDSTNIKELAKKSQESGFKFLEGSNSLSKSNDNNNTLQETAAAVKKLTFKDLCSVGQGIRSIQERSELYKGVIDSLKEGSEKYQWLFAFKNSVLCKCTTGSLKFKVVVTKEILKDVVQVVHKTFHDVDKRELFTAFQEFVYPNMVPLGLSKCVEQVLKACPDCCKKSSLPLVVEKTFEKKSVKKPVNTIDKVAKTIDVGQEANKSCFNAINPSKEILSFKSFYDLGESVKHLQEKSKIYREIINSLTKGEQTHSDHYSLRNSVLCKLEGQGIKIVVPRHSIDEFLEVFHKKYHSYSKQELCVSIHQFVFPSFSDLDRYIQEVLDKCADCKGPPKLSSISEIEQNKSEMSDVDMRYVLQAQAPNYINVPPVNQPEFVKNTISSPKKNESNNDYKLYPKYPGTEGMNTNFLQISNLDNQLTLHNVLNIGRDIRTVQENSLLYRDIIESLEKGCDTYSSLYTVKNTVLCKNEDGVQKIVVPRDNLNDFILILHKFFHNVFIDELSKFIEKNVFPVEPHLSQEVRKVFTECSWCIAAFNLQVDKNAYDMSSHYYSYNMNDNLSNIDQSVSTIEEKGNEVINADTETSAYNQIETGKNTCIKIESFNEMPQAQPSKFTMKKMEFYCFTSLGKKIRPLQEKSANYKSIIDSLEAGNTKYKAMYTFRKNALCKIMGKKMCSYLKIVAPPDQFKPIIQVIYESYSSVDQEILCHSINDYLYPTVKIVDAREILNELMGNKIVGGEDKSLSTDYKKSTDVSNVVVPAGYERAVKSKPFIGKAGSQVKTPINEPDDKIDTSTNPSNEKPSLNNTSTKPVDNKQTSAASITKSTTVNDKSTGVASAEISTKPIDKKPADGSANTSKAVGKKSVDLESTGTPTKPVDKKPMGTGSAVTSTAVNEKSNEGVKKKDFPYLVREVQSKSKELDEIINSLSSGVKPENGNSYLLKGGMLCQKIQTDNKFETKIVAPLSQIENVIEIVHTMSSTHSTLEKVLAFFSKYFTPVDGLKTKVEEYIKKCSKCTK